MNISWIIFNDFRIYLRIARLRFATLETRSERILLIKFFILFSTPESSRIDFFQHLHTIEHEICSLSVVICSFVTLTHSLVCHRNHSNHLHYYCHSRIFGKKSRSRARCEIEMGKCTRYVCMWRWWCRRDYNTKILQRSQQKARRESSNWNQPDERCEQQWSRNYYFFRLFLCVSFFCFSSSSSSSPRILIVCARHLASQRSSDDNDDFHTRIIFISYQAHLSLMTLCENGVKKCLKNSL